MKKQTNRCPLFLLFLSLGCASAFSLSAQVRTNVTVRPLQMNRTALETKALPAAKFGELRPKDLAQTEKLTIAKGLAAKAKIAEAEISGFGSSVKITPRDGFIEGKGKLRLGSDTVGVDYENSCAVIAKCDGLVNPVNCEFKPSVAGKYLVDITVHSAYNESVTYAVGAEGKYGDNHVNISESIPDSVGHVTFLYQVKSADWCTVYIHADKQWVFYSCEVTQIK